MRGTHRAIQKVVNTVGITPAYAGNTCCRAQVDRSHWDHPRVCGEHDFDEQAVSAEAGSPPRMRGTLRWKAGEQLFMGITPAYAGNTTLSIIIVAISRDHPRVCGEHLPVAL